MQFFSQSLFLLVKDAEIFECMFAWKERQRGVWQIVPPRKSSLLLSQPRAYKFSEFDSKSFRVEVLGTFVCCTCRKIKNGGSLEWEVWNDPKRGSLNSLDLLYYRISPPFPTFASRLLLIFLDLYSKGLRIHNISWPLERQVTRSPLERQVTRSHMFRKFDLLITMNAFSNNAFSSPEI